MTRFQGDGYTIDTAPNGDLAYSGGWTRRYRLFGEVVLAVVVSPGLPAVFRKRRLWSHLGSGYWRWPRDGSVGRAWLGFRLGEWSAEVMQYRAESDAGQYAPYPPA